MTMLDPKKWPVTRALLGSDFRVRDDLLGYWINGRMYITPQAERKPTIEVTNLNGDYRETPVATPQFLLTATRYE